MVFLGLHYAIWVVVALYFWAPVVRGWIAGDDPPAEPVAAVPTAGFGPIGLPEAAPAAPTLPAEHRE